MSLATVIRQRELVEQRHLVGRAHAERALSAAKQHALYAEQRLAGGVVRGGETMTSAGVRAIRTQGLALIDELTLRADEVVSAQRRVEQAEAQRIQAAIARRSVERLKQRRDEAAAIEATRRQQARDDELAMIVWRQNR